MLYLVVFFSNVCDIYVCYMLNKITYLLTYLTIKYRDLTSTQHLSTNTNTDTPKYDN